MTSALSQPHILKRTNSRNGGCWEPFWEQGMQAGVGWGVVWFLLWLWRDNAKKTRGNVNRFQHWNTIQSLFVTKNHSRTTIFRQLDDTICCILFSPLYITLVTHINLHLLKSDMTKNWKLPTWVGNNYKAEWEAVSRSKPKPQMSLNRPGSMPLTWISFIWQCETCSGTRRGVSHILSLKNSGVRMWEIQHLIVKNRMAWTFSWWVQIVHQESVWFNVSVFLHTLYTYLGQYKPQSSSIQGLVSFQCLNISWKQKRDHKKKFMDDSTWLNTGTPLLPSRGAQALLSFAFTDNHGKNWFLKFHRKPEHIASCLCPPLSLFQCVITSLSWKCGHSSTLFTYSLHQAGPAHILYDCCWLSDAFQSLAYSANGTILRVQKIPAKMN